MCFVACFSFLNVIRSVVAVSRACGAHIEFTLSVSQVDDGASLPVIFFFSFCVGATHKIHNETHV